LDDVLQPPRQFAVAAAEGAKAAAAINMALQEQTGLAVT
jgi:hypothetical protein